MAWVGASQVQGVQMWWEGLAELARVGAFVHKAIALPYSYQSVSACYSGAILSVFIRVTCAQMGDQIRLVGVLSLRQYWHVLLREDQVRCCNSLRLT